MRMRLLFVAALTIGGLALPGQADATTAQGSPSHVAAHLSKRAGGFVDPVAVTTARDGATRTFVTEQRGTVRLVNNGTQVQSSSTSTSAPGWGRGVGRGC